MKTKKNYSFSRYVIIQFAIYTLIILGVTIVTYFLINWRLSNSFLVLDDFLEYKDKLEYEDYAGIPMSKFPGCDFAVYDNNNELIYTTDDNTEDAVLGSDLIFINDYSNVYYDIFNYRNSRHFIETIKQARKFEKVSQKKLVIFAGACQSYFEAIISAGANFASSPARILIDFLDPLIVAKNVAETDNMKYVTIDDFASELRDGKNGVDGIGARGKKSIIII